MQKSKYSIKSGGNVWSSRKFTLWYSAVYWLTQFTLTTSIPSWDLVHWTQTIIWSFISECKASLCHVQRISNHLPCVSVYNVHCVLCYVRVYVNDIWFLVQCVIRRFPLKLVGRILKAECHILRTGEGIYEVAQDAVYFITYFLCSTRATEILCTTDIIPN